VNVSLFLTYGLVMMFIRAAGTLICTGGEKPKRYGFFDFLFSVIDIIVIITIVMT
jgi:hypothetical protein